MKNINCKLTDDSILINISDTENTIGNVDAIRIYNLWNWEKHLRGDKDIKYKESVYSIKNQTNDNIEIEISPDVHTETLIIIEIDIDEETIHKVFINELSIFKAKCIYLEGLTKCSPCNTCRKCKEYKDLLGLMTFMLRLSLLMDSYKYDNEELMFRYYKDLQRHVNLDRILFTYLNLNNINYSNPDNLHDIFHKLNIIIKHNVSPDVRKIFESLVISDLYSILFGKTDSEQMQRDWILEDGIWGYDEHWYDDGIWKNG